MEMEKEYEQIIRTIVAARLEFMYKELQDKPECKELMEEKIKAWDRIEGTLPNALSLMDDYLCAGNALDTYYTDNAYVTGFTDCLRLFKIFSR